VSHVSRTWRLRRGFRRFGTWAILFLAVPFALSGQDSSVQPGNPEPPVRVPSNVAWTRETVALASRGDAFRGLLIARRCNHCHGEEGFSSVPLIPNLAGEDQLSFWKQLEDFRSGKRNSAAMQGIANGLSARDSADLSAYYSMLPTASDPQDRRSFPLAMQDPSRAGIAVRLIVFGDGQRGIPPCQSCHGPVGYVKGSPPLSTQNGGYLLQQLEYFANGHRTNDINVRMRSIARQLTEEEKTALSEYYGAGLGPGVSPRR
jgi:cytochrome c553